LQFFLGILRSPATVTNFSSHVVDEDEDEEIDENCQKSREPDSVEIIVQLKRYSIEARTIINGALDSTMRMATDTRVHARRGAMIGDGVDQKKPSDETEEDQWRLVD